MCSLCLNYIVIESPQAVSSPSLKRQKTVTEFLTSNRYRNAKLKQFKIFTEEEIGRAGSNMERRRREFWNNKAEQICTNKETSRLGKTAMTGIIDVSWTLRKTTFIEEDVKHTEDQEKSLRENMPKFKAGKLHQKKETIHKNMERMSLAHTAFVSVDREMSTARKNAQKCKGKAEKDKLGKECERIKILLNGAYTELKRAQDAAMKSLKVKRDFLDRQLKSFKEGDDDDKEDKDD